MTEVSGRLLARCCMYNCHTYESSRLSFDSLFLPKELEFMCVGIYLFAASQVPTGDGCYRDNPVKGSREL